jgi:hypothetical protein
LSPTRWKQRSREVDGLVTDASAPCSSWRTRSGCARRPRRCFRRSRAEVNRRRSAGWLCPWRLPYYWRKQRVRRPCNRPILLRLLTLAGVSTRPAVAPPVNTGTSGIDLIERYMLRHDSFLPVFLAGSRFSRSCCVQEKALGGLAFLLMTGLLPRVFFSLSSSTSARVPGGGSMASGGTHAPLERRGWSTVEGGDATVVAEGRCLFPDFEVVSSPGGSFCRIAISPSLNA